ncbi:hypothetical protein DFP72DRAFT_467939 [Ephemerocybe angulata]|uniref:DUF6533 domain-containing protein n=1 Tax=Ephemerocybe angulata TaxID=980116 RepID=A0A8H6HRM3_9AGAR|nr:hypothetical protein DFP72DRAFT_467939 [Tulosesus angulatus]
MASMSEADFVRISVMLTTIATRLQISAYTAYISHYFETLADEVGLIWPERWMLGKVLFLLTRYSVFLRIIFELFGSFPSELPLSVETCAALSLVAYAMSTIVTYSAIGSILLCMYALLGARRKWLPLCLFPFFGSLIVNVVGVTLDFRSSTPFSDPNLPSTYKCNFSASDRRWWTMSAYNILARDIWMLLLGGLTIYLRYRSQKNSLLTVIKRDGAVFYLGACSISIFAAIWYAPGVIVPDDYSATTLIGQVLRPILAIQLLLNMKKTASRNLIVEGDEGKTAHHPVKSLLLFARSETESDASDATYA